MPDSGRRDDARQLRKAAGRDREGSLRDAAGQERDHAAASRDQAGNDSFTLGQQRDIAGMVRDLAAAERDQIAERDAAAEQDEQAGRDGPAGVTWEQISALAAADRQAAALDRIEALRDRVLSLQARVDAAHDRAAAERDRAASAVARAQSADDRSEAAGDRTRSLARLVNASTDALTGVYLRGPGLVELNREIQRARRTDQPLTLAYLDVDQLKLVNDRSGHAAGDELIQTLVGRLRAAVRSYDLVIRVGGDEFLCALSGLTCEKVAARLEPLKASPNSPDPPTSAGTFSIGLAELQPGDTRASLIARADEQLLRARSAIPFQPTQAVDR